LGVRTPRFGSQLSKPLFSTRKLPIKLIILNFDLHVLAERLELNLIISIFGGFKVRIPFFFLKDWNGNIFKKKLQDASKEKQKNVILSRN
jgi:uncharacterized metal-binding protein